MVQARSDRTIVMNGALTIGTRDGATIEMAEEAGEDHLGEQGQPHRDDLAILSQPTDRLIEEGGLGLPMPRKAGGLSHRKAKALHFRDCPDSLAFVAQSAQRRRGYKVGKRMQHTDEQNPLCQSFRNCEGERDQVATKRQNDLLRLTNSRMLGNAKQERERVTVVP
jgi:Carbohydrate phosphorylase